MKMMHGAVFLACSNRSRTRDAPTPTNISTKSEPEMEKNGTPASPAIARASSVLPVPGGPTSSTPLGIRAPSAWNFFGYLRNSTTSASSSLASSTPATSSNVTFGRFSVSSLARLLPNDSAWLPPDCAWRMKIMMSTMMTTMGTMLKRYAQVCIVLPLAGSPLTLMPFKISRSPSSLLISVLGIATFSVVSPARWACAWSVPRTTSWIDSGALVTWVTNSLYDMVFCACELCLYHAMPSATSTAATAHTSRYRTNFANA